MSFWSYANIAAWALCGVFFLLIVTDLIRTEKAGRKDREIHTETGRPTE